MIINGPRALGMWSGATNATICTILTGPTVSGEFWARQESADECAAIVGRTIESWVVFARMVLYFYIMVQLVHVGILGLARSAMENSAHLLTARWAGVARKSETTSNRES